jgi:hypothetical protein
MRQPAASWGAGAQPLLPSLDVVACIDAGEAPATDEAREQEPIVCTRLIVAGEAGVRGDRRRRSPAGRQRPSLQTIDGLAWDDEDRHR